MTNKTVLVWDLPTRAFHWLLVFSFAGAYLTADSERLQLIHITFGYTLAGLLAFRLLWGVFGTRYAQFRHFLPSITKAWQYARSLVGHGSAPAYIGHNPLGALAIYALLVLGVIVSVTGYGYWQELGGDWLEKSHELSAELMLILVGGHILGVIMSSIAHKENLLRAMVTGRKRGESTQAIDSPVNIVGIVLIVAVAIFWLIAYLQPAILGLVEL